MNNYKNWTEEKEQCAGTLRLQLLWLFYRYTNKICLKILFFPIYCIIFMFVKKPKNASRKYRGILNNFCFKNNIYFKNFSTFSHIYAYADSMIDKFDACTLAKNLPFFTIDKDSDFKILKSFLDNKKGCFFICSHLGNIEVLPAILNVNKNLPQTMCHAFMKVSQSPIFHKFFKEHFLSKNTKIYPIENINIETSIEMKDFLDKGHIVMMAGDRTASKKENENIKVSFLGESVHFPKGTFRFSQMMEVPVFFIVCVKEKNNTYKIYIKKANDNFLKRSEVNALAQEYACFIESLMPLYSTQWFQFYDFF